MSKMSHESCIVTLGSYDKDFRCSCECHTPACEHPEYRRLNCEDCYLKEEECEEMVCTQCGATKEEE